eukprot:1788317-Rhodomonas_salina.1
MQHVDADTANTDPLLCHECQAETLAHAELKWPKFTMPWSRAKKTKKRKYKVPYSIYPEYETEFDKSDTWVLSVIVVRPNTQKYSSQPTSEWKFMEIEHIKRFYPDIDKEYVKKKDIYRGMSAFTYLEKQENTKTIPQPKLDAKFYRMDDHFMKTVNQNFPVSDCITTYDGDVAILVIPLLQNWKGFLNTVQATVGRDEYNNLIKQEIHLDNESMDVLHALSKTVQKQTTPDFKQWQRDEKPEMRFVEINYFDIWQKGTMPAQAGAGLRIQQKQPPFTFYGPTRQTANSRGFRPANANRMI